MKKVFIVFLIFAYLNCYMGCVKSTPITVAFDELDRSTNDNPLVVMTKDSTEYYFDADMYRFLGDTLDGIARVNDQSERVKLAGSDIVSISYSHSQVKEETFWLIGIIALGVIILIAATNSNDDALFDDLPGEWW